MGERSEGCTATGVLPTPKLRWNMFGGTVGGPIIKNKLFFFADYQGGRLDFPSTASFINVLTPAQIGGNFGSLSAQLYNPCAAGTGGTSGVDLLDLAAGRPDPVCRRTSFPPTCWTLSFTALVTNSLYPQSVALGSTGFGQAVNTTAQQFNSDQGDIKVDYNVSNNDHFFARYSKGNQYDPSSNSVALLGNTVNEAYLRMEL